MPQAVDGIASTVEQLTERFATWNAASPHWKDDRKHQLRPSLR